MEGAADMITIIPSNPSHCKSYQIQRTLGRGEKSVVFVATDDESRNVAIKLEPEKDSYQLTNEIWALTKLTGVSGVPRLLFAGRTQFRGIMYCAMVTDVIGISSLADLSRPTEYGLNLIANQALDILFQIHKRGVSHNDIKPEHIIFNSNGNMFLIDFGAATKLGDKVKIGTPQYAATSGMFGIAVSSIDGLILDF